MKKQAIALVLPFLLLCGCCGDHDPPQMMPLSPTTLPSREAWTYNDEQRLMYYLGRYVAYEGHTHRGQHFGELSLLLDNYHRHDHSVSEQQVLTILGPPDLYTERKQYKLFVYFFDRFGKRDWVVYVTLKDGMLFEIGWNGARVNDHSHYRHYPATTQPTNADQR